MEKVQGCKLENFDTFLPQFLCLEKGKLFWFFFFFGDVKRWNSKTFFSVVSVVSSLYQNFQF